MDGAERQLASFIARFSPEVAVLGGTVLAGLIGKSISPKQRPRRPAAA